MKHLRRGSFGEAAQRKRRPLWVVVAFLLTVLLTQTLPNGLAAQVVVTPVATNTPATEVTPTATASTEQPTPGSLQGTTVPSEPIPSEPIPSETIPSETVSMLSVAGNLASEQIKALVRARILALIRVRIALSTAQETNTQETNTQETNSEKIVLLPMVMGGTAAPSTESAAIDTTITPPTLSTPNIPITAEEVTPTPVIEDVPISPTATATPFPVVVPLGEPTPDGSPRTAQVPILMYHYLSEPPAGADIYRRDLSVTPSLFAQHLDRLLTEGYTTIRLNDLLLHLTQGAPLPPKPVILTFDDGYRDNYVNAFPLLRDRGMTATFFIVTDFIDDQRPEYLSWDMVREMYAGGMAIESHGRNHASLANRDADYLVWQALGSLETIEFELGVRPRFVSYPAGDYDENTIRIFQSANYWAGVTTKQGATHSSDDLFQLRRVRVRGTTTADNLIGLLAIDW